MRKLFLSIVAVAMFATSALFAQDVERFVGIYLDADSGSLLGDYLWEGNDFEFGVTYGQNFASVPWLSTSLTVLMSMGQTSVGWTEKGDKDDEWTAHTVGQQADWGLATLPKAVLGLGIDGSGFGADGLEIGLSIDTTAYLSFELGYGLEVGPGTLFFALGTDLYVNPVYDQNSLNSYQTGFNSDAAKSTYEDYKKGYVFDDAYFTIGYGIGFAEIWGFESAFSVRLDSCGDGSSAMLIAFFEQNIGTGLNLRWDNNISVDFTGGFSAWAGLRLSVADLVRDGEFDFNGNKYEVKYEGDDDKVDVDLALRAGVSYTFDL